MVIYPYGGKVSRAIMDISMKKLSLKERDELVTKGYLEDVLNARFDEKFRIMTEGFFDH